MIYVITHKIFEKVTNDELYKILHVGKNNNYQSDYLRDDLLDNIAYKNPQYCELTGIYWIWKNCTDSIVGIVHYRRYFVSIVGKIMSKCKYTRNFVHPLKGSKLYKYLDKYDIVIPKINKNVSTIYNLYKFHHNSDDMDKLRNILLEKFPDYINSFDEIMQGYEMFNFNMMICKKEFFDEYCEWLFEILFELERREKIVYEDLYQNRVYGFLAERLLNVWVKSKQYKVKELFTYNSETFGI